MSLCYLNLNRCDGDGALVSHMSCNGVTCDKLINNKLSANVSIDSMALIRRRDEGSWYDWILDRCRRSSALTNYVFLLNSLQIHFFVRFLKCFASSHAFRKCGAGSCKNPFLWYFNADAHCGTFEIECNCIDFVKNANTSQSSSSSIRERHSFYANVSHSISLIFSIWTKTSKWMATN